MLNIKLIVAYDGAGLLGWQKNPLGPTVEGFLEEILSKILGENITLQAASRTDAGVHAEGQVVNFFSQKSSLDLGKLKSSLNKLLPKQIVVLDATEEKETFHPTLDSLGKEYHYYICNIPYQKPKNRFFSWHFPATIDLQKVEEAIPHFLGTHDFSALCNKQPLPLKDPICTLESITLDCLEPGRIRIKVKGNRFLFRMVRNLVGTLAHIGSGKIAPSKISFLLSERKRVSTGITAPSHGLHLIQIFYQKMT